MVVAAAEVLGRGTVGAQAICHDHVGTAQLLPELSTQLRLVGLADLNGYVYTLSRNMLADALGLSSVHVNRVLRQLHEEGLCAFQKARVLFDDYEGLVKLAGRDRAYVDYQGPLFPKSRGPARGQPQGCFEKGNGYLRRLLVIEATSAKRRPKRRTVPIMTASRPWPGAQLSRLPRSSKLEEDIRNTFGLWPGLIRFADDGRLEMTPTWRKTRSV